MDSSTKVTENDILRERAEGKLSADAAFGKIYTLYASTIRAWVRFKTAETDADELLRDVWVVFFNRWQSWHLEDAESDQRPVLSFLFRTLRVLLDAHQRRKKMRTVQQPAKTESANPPDGSEASHPVEVGPTLLQAKEKCGPEEMDVLLAKLAGIPVIEIARCLEITKGVVEERSRQGLARVQEGKT